MEIKIINESEFFIEEESNELDLLSEIGGLNKEELNENGNGIEIKSEDYDSFSKDPSKILRIEATLSDSWGGVRSCGDRGRIRGIVDSNAENWVKTQLFENRQLRWIRYGWTYTSARVRNGRHGWPNNGRWCRGTINFPVFIEFVKP